jgi:hypothetical protein
LPQGAIQTLAAPTVGQPSAAAYDAGIPATPAPKYGSDIGRRIRVVLDNPRPDGFARWTGPLVAAELGDAHEQQVWRFPRAQRIDHPRRAVKGARHEPGVRAEPRLLRCKR